ncbi:MAG: hypothetical protein H8E66_04835 [Planctomycetes bacterium]|nr:hypothetical protein [Planctomycetota bacterium]
MRTVELTEECSDVAGQLGYQIRHEWLGGSGGGVCEFGGRKWIFIDLALNADEQLEQITEALQQDPGLHLCQIGSSLSRHLGIKRAA